MPCHLVILCRDCECRAGLAALQRVRDLWQSAPVACQLSEHVVSGIIQRAREAAVAAFPLQSRMVRAVAGISNSPHLYYFSTQ